MKNIIIVITFILSIFTSHFCMAVEPVNNDATILNAESKVMNKPQDSLRDLAGKVTRSKGKVYYHENNSVRATRITEEPQNLYVSDILRTKSDSKAFLTLSDDSRLVLDENSVIHFNGVKQITAEQGIVLFDIKKQGDLKGLKITTKTAVIGIKGTQFIIDTNSDSLKLYMKEGLVNVKAINDGTFEHHLKKEQSYKEYLQEMFNSFSEYKKKQQEEFVEFVKSIDVPKDKAISISGNKLEDIEIPDHIKEQFRILDEPGNNEENKDPFSDDIFKGMKQ